MKKLQKQSTEIIDLRDQTNSTKSSHRDLHLNNIETKKENQSRDQYVKSSTVAKTPFQDQINSIDQIGKDANKKRKEEIGKEIGNVGRTGWNGDTIRHRNVTRSTSSQEGVLSKNDPFTQQPQWGKLPGYTSQVTPGDWKVKK